MSRFLLREIATLVLGLTITGCTEGSTAPGSRLANRAPSARVIAPLPGSVFTHGDTIVFEGSGTDPEDGALPSHAVSWHSSADGWMGSGLRLPNDRLSVGPHAITMIAVDSEGAEASAFSTLWVLEKPEPAPQPGPPAPPPPQPDTVLVSVGPDRVDYLVRWGDRGEAATLRLAWSGGAECRALCGSPLRDATSPVMGTVARDSHDEALTVWLDYSSGPDTLGSVTVPARGRATTPPPGGGNPPPQDGGEGSGEPPQEESSPPPPPPPPGPPPPPPPPATPPSSMTRVTERFFNAPGEDGWGSNPGGSNRYVSDPTAPIDAPTVLEMPFGPCTGCGGNSMGNQIVKNFDAQAGQELYVTFTMKYSSNWEGNPSGVNKLMYPATLGALNTPVYFAAYGVGQSPLRFQVHLQGQDSGLCGQSTTRNLTPQNGGRIVRGQWHTVEVYMRLNTQASATTCDGVVRVWIDGVLTHDYTDVHFLDATWPAANWAWARLNFAPVWGGLKGDLAARQWLRTAYLLAKTH